MLWKRNCGNSESNYLMILNLEKYKNKSRKSTIRCYCEYGNKCFFEGKSRKLFCELNDVLRQGFKSPESCKAV